MASQWQPPAEQEFNHKWLLPSHAIVYVGSSHDSESTTRRWLLARLKIGVIHAVARTTEINGQRIDFSAVPARLWKQLDEWGDDHFWQTGDQVFHHAGDSIHMLDIRFDPETFGSRARKPPPPEPVYAPAATKEQESGGMIGARDDKRDHLSASDAESFCKFLLEIRPDISERDAYKRAVGFFHDRKVARDWFWGIFRPIRGHKNRGKVPKNRN